MSMDPLIRLLELRLKRQRGSIAETEAQLKLALESVRSADKQMDLVPGVFLGQSSQAKGK